ncbi:hypothetical protein LJY25_21170, partial [Hymenobacter sp. BT175]|uniref:DUF7948 domain-containing protein n=1 Tax=Hymenobacter translucens TaxID=2886507 RepID=UPI001D0E9A2B
MRRTLLIYLSFLLLPVLSRAADPASARSLEFVENRGQWDARARFAADLPTGRLYLGSASFTYVLVDGPSPHAHQPKGSAEAPKLTKAHAYTVEFEGALGSGRVQGEEALG